VREIFYEKHSKKSFIDCDYGMGGATITHVNANPCDCRGQCGYADSQCQKDAETKKNKTTGDGYARAQAVMTYGQEIKNCAAKNSACRKNCLQLYGECKSLKGATDFFNEAIKANNAQ